MSRGVDIYRYQTVTDWRALAGAVSWLYVKLTDGSGSAVVRGDRQVNGARGAGIPVGGYHYAQFYPSPEKQADVLMAEVRRLGATGLPPALDLEAPFTSNSTAKDFAMRFCRRIASQGYRPAVYMSASFAGVLRPDQWGIPGLVIWIAAYGTNSGATYNPDPRRGDPAKVRRYYSGRYDVHQFTSTGRIPGISGNVDVNESITNFYGTVEEEVSAADVWNHKISFTPPGRTEPIEFSAGQYLVWGNYYAGLIEKLFQVIAANELNDLTEDKLRVMHEQQMAELGEVISNATIDVDVTVGGQAVQEEGSTQ